MSVVKIGDRDINLRKALPWTLGDWEDLEVNEGISPTRLKDTPSTKELVAMVWAVLKKADPTVTREEVRGLDLGGPEIKAILDVLNNQVPDRPFSIPSTSSPVPTDGPAST